MARPRFVKINSNTAVNPDMVEAVTLQTMGGRESVILNMLSGKKVTLPSSLSMDDVLKKMDGESNV